MELKSIAYTYLLAMADDIQGHEFYLGLITELGNMHNNAKENTQ